MPTADSKTNLRKLVTGAQLPALPQSAIRLLELSKDPDNGPPEFAVPIESDPGLTGQVLRFVNSSYYGFAHEISSIKLAISLVGIRTVKNFALWSAVFSLMPNPKCGPFELKSLWQDSLRRGVFARAFGKVIGLAEAEDLFAVALLQDMAIPLLAKELPDKYQMLLDGRDGGSVPLSVLEQEEFGWNHAEAGGLMARGWSLPESFAALVETHTQRDRLLGDDNASPGASAVGLSAMLPSTCDQEWFEREQFLSAYAVLAGRSAPSPIDLFALVDNEFTEFAPILNLAVPATALADCLETEQGIRT